MFDAAWFERWQWLLLLILEEPILGRWFRWLLCIRPHDVGYRGRIVRLLPHAYVVANNDGTFTADFRTHDKFAKRLYYGLRPFWRACHLWDLAIANRFRPAWNLGFDTLGPLYPDAGSGATTVDGRVENSPGGNVSWATIIAGAGTTAEVVSTHNASVGWQDGTVSNTFSSLWRGISTYNTAALGTGAVISTATLSFFGSGQSNDGSNPNFNVYGATPASNNALVAADFTQVGSTAFSTAINVTAWSTSGYNDFLLNANGLANINKSGISRFGERNANYDVAAVAPSWSTSGNLIFIEHWNADQTGTANDPKLVVTFTPTVVVTAKGTFATKSNTDPILSSISVPNGETLIVSLFAGNDNANSRRMQFNGNEMTKDVNVEGLFANANTYLSVFRWLNNTGSTVTGNLRYLTSTGTALTGVGIAGTANSLTNLDTTSPFDQHSTTDSAGATSADSGNTGTTTAAAEILIGFLCTRGPNTDAAGTWGGDTATSGQRGGTTGGSANSNYTVYDANGAQSATGVRHAAVTGLSAGRAYTLGIVTYKQASSGAALSGGPATASWAITAATLVASGAVALSGTKPVATWAITAASFAAPQALSGGPATATWTATAATIAKGPVALSGGPAAATWAITAATLSGATALTGTKPVATWTATAATLTASGSGAIGGVPVVATWTATPAALTKGSVALTAATPAIATWTSTPAVLRGTGAATLAGVSVSATWAITIGSLAPPPPPIASIFLEMEFSGRGNGWTEVKDWRLADGLRWDRGLPGNGVADCIADTGTLNFVLNNAITNSVHLIGYYSPDHANCRAGFQLMIGVRVRITIGAAEYVRFTGYLDYINPQPGMHQNFGVDCEAIGWMGLAARTRLGDLPILLDASGDDVFQTIIDSLPTFSQPRAIEKDLSADVYPYILDRIRDEETHANDELYRLALSGLDRIWERGNGTLVYESRTRRATRTADIDTFPDTHGFGAPRTADTVANSTQTTVHPRLPSAVSNAVLFSLNQPMQLAVGQPVDVLGTWTDPTNPDVRVGAVSLVSLVSGTDYVANSAQDGSGIDLTAALTVAVGLSGNATAFTVTLGGSTPGWLTKLQQRGRALLDYGDVQAMQKDQGSIDRFGLNPLNVDMPYQADPNFGIEVGQYIIFTRAQPLTQVEAFRRVIGMKNSPELARSLAREVSDRIGITEPVTGVQKSFFIERISETIYATHVETEWTLSLPIDGRQFWQLEVVGRGELDINTRLGFGLIVGHTDVHHADFHGDSLHSDSAHVDTHTDDLHQDQLHGDGSTHGDTAHSDTQHSDRAHTDVAHLDEHADDPFEDHTDNSHSDVQHLDDHFDYHGDFFDAAHGVAFGDHGDTHTDQAHGDAHGDSPHIDERHEDFSDSVPHNDVPHGDVAHVDIAHNDASSHSDVLHADVLHADVAHVDVAHGDAAHADNHDDTAHGDAN